MSDDAAPTQPRTRRSGSPSGGSGSAQPAPGAPSSASTYASAGAESEPLDLRAIWRAIARNKWLVLGSIVVCVALAYAIAQTLTPRYATQTEITVETVIESAQEAQELIGYGGGSPGLRAEIATLTSDRLLGSIVDSENLVETPEYNPALRETTWSERASATTGALLDGARAAAPKLADGDPAGAWETLARHLARAESDTAAEREAAADPAAARQRAIALLADKLGTRVDEDAGIVTVTVNARTADRAAAIANNLAERYLAQRYEAIESQLRQAVQRRRERIDVLRSDLRQAENELARLRDQADGIAGSNSDIVGQQVATLNSELVRVRAERQQAEARLDQLRRRVEADGRLAAARRLEAPSLQRLRQKESELLRRRSELATRYGERHPRMQNLSAELETVREQMAAAVDDILQQRGDEVELLEEREASLQQRLDQAMAEIGQDAQQTTAIRAAERRVSVKETQLASERERLTALEEALSSLTVQGGVEAFVEANIITPAEPPGGPNSLQTPTTVSIGAMGGLMLGLGLVLLVELMDMGVRTPEQLERLTGLPVVGMIPLAKAKGRYAAAQEIVDDPTSPFAETVNSVLMAVSAGRRAEQARVVAVTSAHPFEGKSAVALAMARVAARTGQRVMLIDADLRRPSIHRHLGMANEANLESLLTGEAGIDAVVQKDPATGLFVVPGRVVKGNPLDLVSSDDFAGLLEALKSYCDLVVIDTPPLLAVADSRSIMRYTDQNLFIVRWGKTHRDAVVAAARTFLYTNPDTVSVALNQVDPKKFAKYRESVSYQYARYLAEAYPPA